MKPHVIHLIASTGLYGAEKWILALMRAMDTDVFRSTLVNLVDHSKDESSDVVQMANSVGLEAADFYTGGTYNPVSIFRLSGFLKKNNVNIVHGHGYKSDLIGLCAGKLAGCRVVTTAHGWSQDAGLKLKCYETLDRNIFRFMDRVCALSQDLARGIGPYVDVDRFRLVLNGVDIEEVLAAPRAAIDNRSVFRIGYVGQLIERKNLPVLLRAFKLLIDRGIRSELLVVGDGPESKRLELLADDLGIQKYVQCLGYRTDAISIMKSLDVFVLPSRLEGIPRCVMEAMVARVPVVVSDIPGNRAIVDEGKCGMLFDMQNHRELADKIASLHSDPARRMEYASRAYDFVVRHFSNIRMASEYQALYRELL